MSRIVGIVLVKNEDLYVEQVLRNIFFFCDEIIVADNLSSDATAEKVKQLCAGDGKLTYHSIGHPGESHELISGFAATQTWVFAVDGDELYDPSGLAELRRKISAGDFDDWWMLLGNVLHCTEFNHKEGYALGHLTPPCRSMTKLYNFSKINYWKGPCPERLHGGDISFKKGYSMAHRLLLYEQMDWESSFFRCLHFCFLPRSSKDVAEAGRAFIRKNISDKNAETILSRLLAALPVKLGGRKESFYKREVYMRGPSVKKVTAAFFPARGGLEDGRGSV